MRIIELNEQDEQKIKDRIIELYGDEITSEQDIELIMSLESEFFIDELEHNYI